MILLTTSILLAFLSITDAASCKDGYQTVNGKCVKVFQATSNYDSAISTCAKDGGSLISIHNAIDNNAILDLFDKSNSSISWMGITCSTDDKKSCQWNDNSTNTFESFAPGFPMTGIGNCVVLELSGSFKGKWISMNCAQTQASFVCESPSVNTDNCDNKVGNYCYYAIQREENAAEAEKYCNSIGANLVSIHSDQENDYVQKLFINNTSFIRLGAIMDDGGTFEWTDQSNFDYINAKLVDKKLGECLSMEMDNDIFDAGVWISSDCQLKLPFVCKRDVTKPIPNPTPIPTQVPLQCNSTSILTENGTIYSPGWPQSYIGDLGRCTYIFYTDEDKIASLKFDEFVLDSGSAIVLYPGIMSRVPFATLTSKNSQSVQNHVFNSSTNALKMIFQPCYKCEEDHGFRWKAQVFSTGNYPQNATVAPPVPVKADTCNSTHIAPNQITSPNWPHNYPNNLECAYLLKAETNQKIRLTFDEINTEPIVDVIVVFDGNSIDSPKLGKASGDLTNKVYESTGNEMLVLFLTDPADNNYRGFNAYFAGF